MSEINIRKRVAVGVFIFLGLAILVVGIFTVGNQHKAFVKTISTRAIFDDIQGLQPGNNVWLSGMKVGTVKRISFYGGSQVEIILSIERQAQSHIRKDAKARISTDGLVGNKIVVISNGSSSDSMPAIADNDLLQTERLAGMQEMMTTLQASNNNLLEITGNLKAISKKLTDGEGTLGELINDPAIADHLRASIDHFRAASANSEKMMANLQAFSESLQKPGGLANELVTDTTVFRQLKGTMAQLNEAADAASEFGASLRTAGKGINDKNTPIGMILHDEETAADLQRTIKNLRVSSKELSDDLEAVQHNFLLRGFFKKKNKSQ
jgi:phospholipid/cholesterol/gamma-HCH transport system substrate-binding protein